jgi:hypothetical protein
LGVGLATFIIATMPLSTQNVIMRYLLYEAGKYQLNSSVENVSGIMESRP